MCSDNYRIVTKSVMSGGGFRGRGFGHRGGRSKGPVNGFGGPRFPRPNFNHPRPPHNRFGVNRPDNWLERPRFIPWQRPQFRGNSQFRANARGRSLNGPGGGRFPGPSRPPGNEFFMGFVRNVRPIIPLQEQVHDIHKTASESPAPLPGSEEERQQKISETADKLKQKLSSITQEDLTNLWDDDSAILPRSGSEAEPTKTKEIPELKHDPPELNLTFTDFRDIGRVDCTNARFENLDEVSDANDDVVLESTNYDIVVLNENERGSIDIVDLEKDTGDVEAPVLFLDDDNCHGSQIYEPFDAEHDSENLELPCPEINDNLVSENFGDIDKGLFVSDVNNTIDFTLDDPVDGTLNSLSIDFKHTEELPGPINIFQNQDIPEKDIIETQDVLQTDIQQNDDVVEENLCQTENTWQTNDPQEVLEENLCQSQDSWQANDSQQVVEGNLCQAEDTWQENDQQEEAEENLCQPESTLNIPQQAEEKNLCQDQDSLQKNNLEEENDEISENVAVLTDATLSPPPPLPSDEEIHSNTICDTEPGVCSPYTPQCTSEKDEGLNSSCNFHSGTFNEPARVVPRIPGPRCHWSSQKNGQNSYFSGQQRFPIHQNVSPQRHITPFVQTDLVPVVYDSRAPPPFNHNIPVSNHDSQHNTLLPYSPNDLTPSYVPSEPPPNLRSIAMSETSSSSETVQPIPSFDSRNASLSISPKNAEIFELPPAFDPRGPPPTITSIVMTKPSEKLPEFNPQHPPPVIINKEGILQPPPIFDARLPSPENSRRVAPTAQVTDFVYTPVIGVPLTQPFIANMQMNYQAVLQLSNTNEITEFSLPPPMKDIPPLPSDHASNENKHLGEQQTINMEEGLEDLRKAMEFANEVMHMGGEEEINKPLIGPVYLDMPLPPSQIPVPTKQLNVQHSLVSHQFISNNSEKPKKTKNKHKKKNKQDNICDSEILNMKQGIPEQATVEVRNAQDPGKSPGDELPPTEQVRPKVVFNLNSKIKKINAAEDWNHESEETKQKKQKIFDGKRNNLHQIMVEEKEHNHERERLHQLKLAKSVAAEKSNEGCYHRDHTEKSNDLSYRRDHTEKSNDAPHRKDHAEKSNDASYRKDYIEKSNDPSHRREHTERSNNVSYRRDHTEKLNDVLSLRNIEKLHSLVSSATTSTNVDVPKRKKLKKQSKKVEAPTSESTWKTRVINRFLKMSKNDICNMVNNSSLRKFDIAMKHLVKEGRPSLSLKMRNTEDEKMKEYDREEFMTQLNAMLDPGAVVAITDLPTEFIHHLSEVLQLDPMPTDPDTYAQEIAGSNDPGKNNQSVVLDTFPSEDPTNGGVPLEPDNVYVDREITKVDDGKRSKFRDIETKLNETPNVPNTQELSNAYYPLDISLLDPGPSQEESSSLKMFTRSRTREERETIPKKQQLLFNEDDLDNILSEVTQQTKRDAPKSTPSHNLPRRSTHVTLETRKNPMPSVRAEIVRYKEASPQIRIRAAADLDDIFSAGIARAKRKTARSEHFRSRKSTSEDRSTIRTEKYERWSRKERENLDTFRNLTKEEWEARYARPMSSSSSSSTIRRSGSNSSENLNRERRNYTSQRYCSSDSPMRHLSISPLAQDHPPINIEKYPNQHDHEQYEESHEALRPGSSSDSTFSSTESSETTVAPDVTKLLKVIKEKEKIAKTKSLNETIRDEVAAEIEMKWREKSKHKERKCRKREKRKKDKRDRRRKEKRRKRKRSSTSCDRSGVPEEFHLLTENEIKKEVIVKEEQDVLFTGLASTDNVISPFVLSCTDATGSVTDNLHNESHGSGTQKQSVSIAICNPEPVPVKSKPITSPIQPKTKAQLKQMPESSEMVRKIVIENSIEVSMNKPKVVSVTNVVQNELNKFTDKCKNDEVASNSTNKQECTLVSTNNNSLQQIDAALTIEQARCTEVVSDISEPKKTTLATTDTVGSSVILNSVQQCADSKPTVTGTLGSTENKGGSKKIDIKAYKERALRRQLKDQSSAKEIPPPNLSPQNVHEISKVQPEPSVIEKQATVTERDREMVKSVLLSSYDPSNKETDAIVTLKDPRKRTHMVQQSTEFPDLKNREISQTEVGNANLIIAENSAVCKDMNTNVHIICSSGTMNESSLQEAMPGKSEIAKSRVKMKSKSSPEDKFKKSNKSTSPNDPSKFKNIRSEGGKELKLKKEKVKKPRETGNVGQTSEIKSSRVNITENHSAKHSLIAGKECALDAETQKLSVTTPNSTRPEIDDNVNPDVIDEFPENLQTTGKENAEIETAPSKTVISVESNILVTGGSTIHGDKNTRNSLISAEIDENRKIEDQVEPCIGDEKILLTVENEKNILKENTNVTSDDTKISDNLCVLEAVEKDGVQESTIEENLTEHTTLLNNLQPFTEDSIAQHESQESTEVVDKVSISSKEQVPVDGEQNINQEIAIKESTVMPVNTTHSLDTMPNANLITSINSANSGIDRNNLDTDKPVFESLCDEINLESVSKDCDDVSEHNDLETNGTMSPDSVHSPFKGFCAESIEDNICKVSIIANIEASVQDIKEELMANSKKWLDMNMDITYRKDNTASKHVITDAEQSVFKSLLNKQGCSSTINTVDKKLPDVSDQEAPMTKVVKPEKNNILEKEDSVTTKELETNKIAITVADNDLGVKERKGGTPQEQGSVTTTELAPNKTAIDVAKDVPHVKERKDSIPEKGAFVTTKQLETNEGATSVLKDKLNVKARKGSTTEKENSAVIKAMETNETAKVVVKDVLHIKERNDSTSGKEDYVTTKVFETNTVGVVTDQIELNTKERKISISEKEDSVTTQKFETNEVVTAIANNELSVNKRTNSISEGEDSVTTKDLETNVTAPDEESQNAFDKGSEQFIVLDEYLDETNVNLKETPIAMGLILEDCIPKNQDNLLDRKPRGEERESESAELKVVEVLSEALGKDDVNGKNDHRQKISTKETKEKTRSNDEKTLNLANTTGTPKNLHVHKVKQKNASVTMDQSSSISAESVAEQSVKPHVRRSKSLEKSSRSIDSNVREISVKARKSSRTIERDKFSLDTITKEASQGPADIESFRTQVEKTEEKNLQCNHKSKNNVDSVKVPKRLHVPTKAALKKSVDIVDSSTAHTSTAETNALESLDLKPPKQTQNSEKRNDDTSHSRKNDSKLNNKARTDGLLQSSDVKLPPSVNSLKHIPVVEIEKSKILDDFIVKKQKVAENVEGQSGRTEEHDALHRIKHKPKMKHKEKKKHEISEKKIKDTVISGNVQFRDSHSKEAIMARMIEIDVEIHKLMTEKMTLYQMLKTDGLPLENNLLSNDATCENKETESAAIRARTPAVLVSQLIQNIETNPVVTGHSIKGTVGITLKENRVDSPQLSKHKVSSKHEHSSKKRDTPSYSSDDEEVMHYTGTTKFPDFKRRKKHKTEKNVKWDSLPVSSGTSHDTSSVEKKKTKEIMKTASKKANNIGAKEIMEPNTTVGSIVEVKVQGIVNELSIQTGNKDTSTSGKSTIATSTSRMGKTLTETTDVPDSVEKRNKSKTLDSSNMPVINNNRDQMITNGILNESATRNSEEKLPDDRTPERSSIYTDESTWESFKNTCSDTNDQKRSSTGLALLEKSYRKEMERSRKLKAEALKKKQSRDVSKTALNLTTEEEELPLSKLYSKKVRRSKDLSETTDQKGEKLSVNDDPQFWRNALAIIDAVAEDRVQDLYTKESAGQSKQDNSTNTVMKVCDVSSSLLNVDPLNMDISTNPNSEVSQEEAKENVSLCTSANVEVSNVGSVANLKDITSSEIVIQETEDLKKDDAESVVSVANLQTEDAVDDVQSNIEFNPQSSEDTFESNSTRNDVTMKENAAELCAEEALSDSDRRIVLTPSVESTDTDTMKTNTTLSHDEDVVQPPEVVNLHAEGQTEEQIEKHDQKDSQVPSVSEDSEMKSDDTIICKSREKDEIACIKDASSTDTVGKTSSYEIENAEEVESTTSSATVSENQTLTADNNTETFNPVPKTDYPLDVGELKESQENTKELERSTDPLSKDNSNGTHISISSPVSEALDTQRNEDSSGRKSSGRKRHKSKVGLRRSSRYTEENTKRMKLADDASTQINEPDVKEKTLGVTLTTKPSTPLSSYDEETDTSTNIKKSRGTQKLSTNRKQAIRLEPETSENPLIVHEVPLPSKEATREIKKRKQHSMLEMMSCHVSLVDSKYTILRSNVNPEVLKKLGISRINVYEHSTSNEADSTLNPSQSASTKEVDIDTERITSVVESKHNQSPKLSQNLEDAIKLKKMQKASKPPLCLSTITQAAECSEPDVQVIKEQITVDVSKVAMAPEIEIVEEKKPVTKSQIHDDPGTTLPVIESKDDKELSRTQYTVHKGPILDIKVFESSFLAASEDGRIYRYSQASNGILNIYKGHKSAVTCLYVYSTGLVDHNKNWMFSGSLDGTLRCYNITTGGQMRDTADIGSPIQCMDQAWGVIFVGTKSGHVSRYHIKSGAVKGNSIQFSDKSVLALKATNEGPRRVLIVASRSQPITIRDAQSGLFLRTICGERSHTVYSLMRHHNFIYCGTSSTSILVFDFTNGDQTTQYDAGVGIVCMRLYKQLLFAGCYDGNIYVFDTKDYRLICSIPGPGNMLLSMEIIGNKIIAGSKDKRLQSWLMPRQVRTLL